MKTLLLEPGRYYHIFNCAKNGTPLFSHEEDFMFFLKLYQSHVTPVADTLAYCLLRDHLHLLVKIREDAVGSLYKPFAILFNSYAKGYNKINDREGIEVFRYKLKRIEIRQRNCLADMIRYINQNARIHGVTDKLVQYSFSSYHATINGNPGFVAKKELVRLFGEGDALIRNINAPVDERNLKFYTME